jgi:hypothetical protein
MDFDLNSLAKQYEFKNDKEKNPSDLECFDSFLNNNNENKEKEIESVSSSIDKLLNNFFCKTHDDKSSKKSNNEITIENSEQEKLNEFSLNDLIGKKSEKSDNSMLITRTKSISISGGDILEDNNADSEDKSAAFSLNDLANQYLAKKLNKSSTSINEKKSSLTSSLVEMIDHEFSNNFGFNEGSTGSNLNLIDLNKENILIKKDKHLSNIKLNEISSSVSSNSSFLSGSKENLKDLTNEKCTIRRVQLIPTTTNLIDLKANINILNKMFNVYENSNFGEFLSTPISEPINPTNEIFETKFNYSSQIDYLNKIKKEITENSIKKIIGIDTDADLNKINAKIAKRAAKTSLTSKRSDQDSKLSKLNNASIESSSTKLSLLKPKSSLSSSLSKKSASNSGKLKPIQIFDFSIPSPDDIVIAKQKFAFKNIRFK